MQPMELARWVIAGVLVAGGGTLVLVNVWIALTLWRTKRHISFIPLIGSVAVTEGLLVAPVRVGAWALLPMAVDPGGPVWLLGATVMWWHARRAAARGGKAAQPKTVAPPRPAARPTLR